MLQKIPLLNKLRFPLPFFQVYTPLWLFFCLILVSADLCTKKLMTKHLNFYLHYQQFQWLPDDAPLKPETKPPKALYGNPQADGKNQINVWGPDGKYIRFRLVFNDRFVFGLGPSLPILGFFLSLLATLFLAFVPLV